LKVIEVNYFLKARFLNMAVPLESWGVALLATALLCVRALAALRRRGRVVAFFHPYCNDGGGGERVLWCAIAALQRRDARVDVVVYTGDTQDGDAILGRARERFCIVLPLGVCFVHLRTRRLLDATTYPRFTLLGQAAGGALVAAEALCRVTPAVFIDSMGCAGAYPVASLLFGCRVACYVHYPTISLEMIRAVSDRRAEHNNDASIASSRWRSAAKVCYYRAFALLYAAAGHFADVVLVNSTWTAGHIRALWGPRRVRVVFPPCDTAALEATPLAPHAREQLVISIAQFRRARAATASRTRARRRGAPARPLPFCSHSSPRAHATGRRRRTRSSSERLRGCASSGPPSTQTRASSCWGRVAARAMSCAWPSSARLRLRSGSTAARASRST
jgi:hypothetical protein